VKALCLQQEKNKDKNASCFFISLLTFDTELHLQARKTKKKRDALIKWEMLSVSSSDSSYLVKELCQQVRKTKREMLQQEEKFAISVSSSAKLDIWCNNFTRERRTRRRQREKCSDKKRTLLLVFLQDQ
jgi:hypothetical protein